MGVITISLDNDSEKMLRNVAKLNYGNQKNALSKTIILAIKRLENSRSDLKKNMIDNIEKKSFKLKIKKIKDRNDYYK